MKKIAALLLALVMVFAVIGCNNAPSAPVADEPVADEPVADEPVADEPVADEPVADGTYEIAMVTDVGNIDDQSFNQFTYEGVKLYAEANGITYSYYRPSEDSDEARIETIKGAIEKGAKIVVCPGYLFAGAFQTVPAEYPDVTFVGIDMSLLDVPEPTANTVLIAYQEEQAGYLAGFAAVKAGYTKLAFLGGMAVPAVIRYGEGFVQGVDAAAAELGNTADIELKYWYSGSFAPTDDIVTKTGGWYTEGTQVIFACGGGILYSAITSAQATADGKIIGVDVDQGYIDERIITSAFKALSDSVQTALAAVYGNGGTLPAEYAGQLVNYGATENAVGIPTAEASWKLGDFTVEEYNALYAKLVSGELVVSNDIENHPTVSIAVDYQE